MFMKIVDFAAVLISQLGRFSVLFSYGSPNSIGKPTYGPFETDGREKNATPLPQHFSGSNEGREAISPKLQALVNSLYRIPG
jgi:hypothetical protein